MSEAKRYAIFPHNSGGYTLKVTSLDDDANVVLATDYDALEAENAKLRYTLEIVNSYVSVENLVDLHHSKHGDQGELVPLPDRPLVDRGPGRFS
jgi:hypothetical protein